MVYNNVKTFSFKEGASTISQQLIKNTHLSNEKTLKRIGRKHTPEAVFEAVKLAKKQNFSVIRRTWLKLYLTVIWCQAV